MGSSRAIQMFPLAIYHQWACISPLTAVLYHLNAVRPRIESLPVYADGVGFVPPPPDTVEALRQTFPYSPQHVYWFVIDIGIAPQTLTLGHGDGGVSDNEGFFAIQLFEVNRARGKKTR